ncbi:L-lactate MFS transporter [Lacticaseibacillus paracasei]|uniref:Permease of the major facilitator superfamily n=1 Tax=Lacticaseibacillus paracasei (strain ATCC 334 / BCRC 17002 / CCUG 31169 / CIP 107868 / KCTC 3260 / NRRL B-441) TaxID=321967 RepID=Q03BF2_LACP3|nr:OFA family MFS transporter [Lacticaseibacillus paracasei]ABJ69470.1 permease of the major facilitator superfamily [Lacticaseibacillus paracasei ATCC 334]KRK17547.1 major facilitator superfamily permease [Lacticaseibacillus casei DSM 20011 = JCM 1134 = ATCC 393]OSY80082.1 MFS transporter [Lacticaseibacillus paracasei]RHX74239.1 MFS transporter [Lacticaseibacillus paracasei]
MSKRRYLVAIGGILLHLMIGSVYAWSVFTGPIAKQTGWALSSVTVAFSIAIFFLGMSAAFMGRLVERFGPRLTGTVAALLYGSGILLTGLAVQLESLPLLYIGYGVVGGLGLGAGYVTPVSTIIAWFPDKRGLATGMAIMGFGFAAMLTGPIAQNLIAGVGLVPTMYVLGTAYLLIMLTAAQVIRKPRPGEVPAADIAKSVSLTGTAMTANQAVKTRSFRYLWLMFFINITCGIGLVAVASPMAQQQTGMSAATAAMMVGVVGLFNGFGRLAWATLSDLIGRPLTYTLIFTVDVAMLAGILVFSSPLLFGIALCLIMSCYGAGFSVIPAYLGDVFGTKQLGAIHGYVLTAWAVAGVVGPTLLSLSDQYFHSYTYSLIFFVALELVAFILSIRIRRQFSVVARDEKVTDSLERQH